MPPDPIQPGPAPVSRAERLRIARKIANRARERHGADLLAVGLYGSMARGTDGPYSDIEIFCILRSPGQEFSHEWVAGPWKAEVDFYSEELLLAEASVVEGRWPLTHGAFHNVLPLDDPEGYFERLATTARGRTDGQFRAAIEGVLVGEMYEFVGKLRNIGAGVSPSSYLPTLAVEMATHGAFLIGLHNRQYYSTGSRVLTEALDLPDRPTGFDELATLVASGRLSDGDEVSAVCERFWQGVGAWAEAYGYQIGAREGIPF